ncbi:MAG: type II toxin-antitoxin system RelE/ParE family toxin [Acidobacteria bacterium]|nr:type II toxin-antitoxin system RelE/ParE family toxin [Acidobacteriota bacterium]MBV9188124.1 type II toxin-antitoxin system RelE/ParE family toxin [Acidobacteriota bacterium]
MNVSFHPAARRELLKHSKWYRDRSISAAAGFEREIDHAVSRIVEAPERYPLTRRGRRRFVLLEYPFDLVYRIRAHEIQIIAVAHHSRRPEYWINRL